MSKFGLDIFKFGFVLIIYDLLDKTGVYFTNCTKCTKCTIMKKIQVTSYYDLLLILFKTLLPI